MITTIKNTTLDQEGEKKKREREKKGSTSQRVTEEGGDYTDDIQWPLLNGMALIMTW